MKRQISLVALFALTLVSAVSAQLVQPKPCKLRIVVTDDRQSPIRDATVEVQDAVGFAAAGTSKQTAQDGQVDFNSYTGGHRIRIVGSEIQTYEGDFEISPNETNHIERIRVKLKSAVGASDAGPSGPPVSAARLKIPKNAEKEYDKGNKAAEKQNWPAASDGYRAAIKLYPDYDLAYNALGIALSSQGDNAGAKAAFEKAIAITPEYAMANRNLARIFLAARDYKDADPLLRKSLQTEPVNAWALTNAAYCELQLKDFSDAAAHALKVHGVPHTGYENSHYIAALALEELGKKADAMAQYDLYLKEAPTGPNATNAHEALARLSQP